MRLFTLDEANRHLPGLDQILTRAQATLARMRHVRDQLVDLRIVWGERVMESSCPDHEEYEAYRREFSELERTLQAATNEVTELGAELKDVENGLVDFVASRGEEVVYLCWRRGEDRVRFWHPLEGGYAARKPLEEF